MLETLENILCTGGIASGLLAITSKLKTQERNIPLIITMVVLLGIGAGISTYREYKEDKEESYSTKSR